MTVVFFGDAHTGSTVALCPPRVDMGEDGIYAANGVQVWLLEQYKKFIDVVKMYPAPRVLVLLGDLVDGARQHGTFQTWGTAQSQVSGAIEVVQPLANLCEVTYGVTGTQCHGGMSGSDDAVVIREFGGKQASRYRWRLRIEGKLFDIAHHAGRDKKETTFGNSAMGLLRQTRLRCDRTGEEKPDYIIRGHAHQADIITHNGMTAALCPGWKLQDEYTRKLDLASLPDVGGLIWEKEAGLVPVTYVPAPDPITEVRLRKK